MMHSIVCSAAFRGGSSVSKQLVAKRGQMFDKLLFAAHISVSFENHYFFRQAKATYNREETDR